MFQNISRFKCIRGLKRNYSTMITIQDGKKNLEEKVKLKPFIVLNILTLIYMNRYHQLKIPYSGAFIMVRPNQPILLKEDHLFSIEYSPVTEVKAIQLTHRNEMQWVSSVPVMNMITERGSQLVHSLLSSFTRVVKNEKRSINVYFTNHNRDDSYRLLRNSMMHYHDLNFKCSSVTRYNNLSNMRVYSSLNNRLLFKVRDFNDLLSYISLDELLNLFCQSHCSTECYTKMIPKHNPSYSTNSMLLHTKSMLVHDIMLYAAIMQKAQQLHWRNFQIDLFYKQNILEKVNKTPNLWIANIYKTFACRQLKNN